MSMTKQQAYYDWLSNCPVSFEIAFSIDSESNQENHKDELVIFRDIPRTKLTVINGTKK